MNPKLKQREWRRVGRATGRLKCSVKLPAIEHAVECRADGAKGFSKFAQFLRKHLPTSETACEGATFTITAEVRASRLGVRWRSLSRWKSGQSVEAALSRGSGAFAALPIEDWAGKFAERWVRKIT